MALKKSTKKINTTSRQNQNSRLQVDRSPKKKQAPEESGDRVGIGESSGPHKFGFHDWNEESKIGREE